MTTPNETSFLREAMDELIAEEGGTRSDWTVLSEARDPFPGWTPRPTMSAAAGCETHSSSGPCPARSTTAR